MNWVLFNGAMVYIDNQTQSRIVELKGRIQDPKRDHIPMFKPKAVSFGLQEVNACVSISKGKDGKFVEKANWKKLVIS